MTADYDAAPDYLDQRRVFVGPGLMEAFLRFRWIVLWSTVIAAVAVYGLSLLEAESYEAESSMLLTDPRTSGVFDDSLFAVEDLSRYVRNQADFVESPAVAARAGELIGGRLSVEEIIDSVVAVAARDLDLVTIRTVQPTGEGAAALADAIGEAYEELVIEQVQSTASAAIAELSSSKVELQDQLDTLDRALVNDPANASLQAARDAAVAQLVNLDTRIAQIDVNMSLYGSGVQYREPAEIPSTPASPRPLRNAAVAAVLGLLGSTAFAWWRAERSPSAESRHDPAPVLGAPLLGEIPDFEHVGVKGPAPMMHEPESAAAEAYRFAASSIEFALDQIGGSVVMVTSVGPR